MNNAIHGVIPVMPAIFNDDGTIDFAGFSAVAEYLLDAGANGIVFPGLASEYDHLTAHERSELTDVLSKVIQGRKPLIVGASGQGQADITDHAKRGAQAGASAAMVLTPRYLGSDVGRLIDFYSALGEDAGLPLMIQNAPEPMGLALSSDTLSEIARSSPSVKWIKEENTPCGQRISSLIAQEVPTLLGVFGGAGGRYIVDELARGVIGSMPASETPHVHVALMSAHRACDAERVGDLYEGVLPLLMMQAIFRWRLTKAVLQRRGLIKSTFTRAPGPALDAGDFVELERVLSRLDRLCVRHDLLNAA